MIRNRKSLWISSISALSILIVGWVIGIEPQLSRVSGANDDRIAVAVQNANNEKVLAQLKKDYQGIDVLENELVTLRTSIPKTGELSTFVSEISALASAHSVSMKSISIDEAKPYTPNVGAVDSQSNTLISNPKITAANFVLIPVQLAVSGNYARVLDFVHSIQTANRLFLISNLGSSGSTSSEGLGKVDSTIGGYIYVLLDS
jgi:Tfp pilus assembly protein PilO